MQSKSLKTTVIFDAMKVSKKAFKSKQNQATGMLIQMVIGILLVLFKSVILYRDYEGSLDWVDVVLVLAWVLVAIISYFNWRKLERENKNLEIDG